MATLTESRRDRRSDRRIDRLRSGPGIRHQLREPAGLMQRARHRVVIARTELAADP
jgi:hypothetical protein